MNESIFSFIKSYTPSVDRDPKEDYLTQIFSWILNNIKDIDEKYCTYLLRKIKTEVNNINEDIIISVDTQTTVSNGRIDMVIKIQNKIGFICEHKVWSNLSDNQINKYKECSDELGNETYYTVLITANKLQHTQDADIKLTWSDIGTFMESLMNEYENEERFILLNFINYLNEQGLWKHEKISMEEITSYYTAKSLESKLDKIFESLITIEWENECDNLKTFTKSKYKPKFNKYRWGRKGIDFFENWYPGLFAGVILDPKDHGIKITDINKGPDLVVILDISNRPVDNKEDGIKNKVVNSKGYKLLLEDLQNVSSDFEAINAKNKWRLVIIRKPLADVLNGKNTNEEQLDAMKETIVEGMNILTKYNLTE